MNLNLNFRFSSRPKLNLSLNFGFSKVLNLNFGFSKTMNLNLNVKFKNFLNFPNHRQSFYKAIGSSKQYSF